MNKSKELITKFKLPSYIIGKSFAEASNLINKKFEGRNDLISKNTKEELLTRLANAQEHVKSLENPEQTEQNQMFLGGYSNTEQGTMTNDQFTNNLTTQYNQNNIDQNSISSLGSIGTSMFSKSNQNQNTGNQLGESSGGISAGGYAQMGTTALNLGTQAFGKPQEYDLNQEIPKVKVGNAALKGSAAGASAGAVAGPWGAAIGAVVGGTAGYIGGAKQKKKADQAMQKQSLMRASKYNNDFALGGPINDPSRLLEGTLDNTTLTNDLVNQYNNQPFPNGQFKYTPELPTPNITTNWYNNNAPYMSLDRMNPKNNKLSKANLKPIGNFINENYGEALRYAPVLSNALQLSKLKKPSMEQLNRLDNRFKPEYADERSLQNIIGSEFNNTINSLTNATNGSQGSLRNNILAAGLNKTKAMSEAYSKIAENNRNMNIQGQQFNSNIDQINLSQDNMEKDINARNIGAYETNKSKLTADLATSIGQIGKEQVFKKYPKMMGLGYNWNGKYFINTETGDTKTEAEAKQLESTNTKSKGGYLSKDVISHINNMYINRKK